MPSQHTRNTVCAIRVAAVVGCASMALFVGLFLVQVLGVAILGHGVVPPEVFASAAGLALLVPTLAAVGIDTVRRVLQGRAGPARRAVALLSLTSFLSAVTALSLPPPRAAL